MRVQSVTWVAIGGCPCDWCGGCLTLALWIADQVRYDSPALWFPAYAERACATVVASSYSAWRGAGWFMLFMAKSWFSVPFR